MKYNTIGFLGFTVNHEDDRIFIEDKDIRTAILTRLASMTDEELQIEIDWGETVENEDSK
tara:strand:+ start:394 stop:573 length:180 start_codon:yes stop_codon:yes gene_type:complete